MTCHMVGMITNVQLFGGLHPKNLGGQRPLNLARFCTTFEFDCECLRNQLRYQKSETNLIEGDSFGV